jgi:hypothetical protein
MAASSPPAEGPRREVSALMGRRTRGLPPPPPLAPPAAAAAELAPAATELESDGGPAEHTADTVQKAAPRRNARAARSGAPAPRPRAAGRTATRSRAVADQDDDRTRPVAAYLPADLRTDVVDAARRSGLTLAEWLLDTYDRVFERLDALYAAGEAEAPRRSGLPQRRTRRRNVLIGVQMQFGLTGAELRVLEDHMSRLQVASRSEFFTLIAQLGLDQRG